MCAEQVRESGVVGVEHFALAFRTGAEARNVKTVRAVFEAFAHADFELLTSRLTPDGEIRAVGVSDRLGDGDEPIDLSAYGAMFPSGMRFEIESCIAEDDHVAVHWNDEALLATGRVYRNEGCSLFEFTRDGQVRRYTEWVDPANFFEAISP